VVVSGRLFGRYIKKLKDNINKIINIPYTYIFTSINFKKLLLNQIFDKYHLLSYDTMITINDGFYNPGGVYDNFDILLYDIKMNQQKLESNINKIPRIKEKMNYEGILTFEYLEKEEDLLAPALYKEIITNEKITKEDCIKFHNHILSFNNENLNKLIKNLSLFKYIPFEMLSKYWARFYTIESDFYKVLNNNLMKSNLSHNYKTFIKMLYTGIEINSLKSYPGKFLYRGSVINKIEIEKIKKFQNLGKLSNIVVFSKAFLSFSENEDKAKGFCGKSDNTKIGCLYILENNNINFHESNADIQNFSFFPQEREILFLPGSSFIIKNIEMNNDNKIKIILNYNGKFKEKYCLIYEDQKRINNIIYNNVLTKNIAGKELKFLKGGKYLLGEKIGEGKFNEIFKGKDLETDEIVVIKKMEKLSNEEYEIDKNKIYKGKLKEWFDKEINAIKIISKNTQYSVRYKDHFETEDYYYIILEYYDDNLGNFLKKNKIYNKNLSPRLINKILNQLNMTFIELLNNKIAHRNIKPENILIKYSNEGKTNFDSILSDYGMSFEYGKIFCMSTIVGRKDIMAPEILYGKYYNNCDLYSIGVLIYFLYFGNYNIQKSELYKIEEDILLEDLLKKLLIADPNKRITWGEYLSHLFFYQYGY